MTYEGVREAVFLARPNRFVAHVLLDGREETVHVKNTGRCRELLVPGAAVFLAPGGTPGRKTAWDLIAVRKGSRLINMDSAAPNRAAAEYLPRLLPGLTSFRPEYTFGDSRFDLFAQRPGERWLIEVKGVTLEEGGAVFFPDAPTLRGQKHLRGLTAALDEGFRTAALFVVQMEEASYFAPHDRTDPAFGAALRRAAAAGVEIHAAVCRVTPEEMRITGEIPVHLAPQDAGEDGHD